METDSVDFGDWIKGGSRRRREKKKRLYMDKTFPEGTQQSRGIPSCEGWDMWTQDSSCDFLNWSKQQQKSWADSKGLQHPDAGPCLSLSVWEKETGGQEHRPATQWKQRAGEKKIHRMRQSAELRKKQNKTEQCWQPGHSPSFDCVKNRRRGVKAELTLEPLESAWRLSHAKQGSSAANVWAETRE